MKRVMVFVAVSLFLIGFIVAGVTTSAIDNTTGTQNKNGLATNNNNEQDQINSGLNTANMNQEEIKALIQEKNKIKTATQNGECPAKCTCTGSATKCQLANGTREMTILAGKSGNMIIQVKGINATTNVTLYKSDNGKIYAVKKNNETKVINMLPDQVRERIRERTRVRLNNENITLNEKGEYEYQAEKEAKLFFIFSVKEKVKAEINAETGEVIRIRNNWWGFLARDKKESILGASCGTVTPGYNNECCKSRGYDLWNNETNDCEFSS